MTTYAIIGVIGLVLVALGTIIIKMLSSAKEALGRSEAVSEGQERTIDNVDKANRASVELERNPAARRKLRKRHTR